MTVELVYGLAPGTVVEAPAVSVSAYVHSTAHQQEAVDYLLSQFDDSPDLQNWVRALIKPFQTLEDVFNVLRGAFDPATAIGDQLTRVGVAVDEEREGRSDATLRAYVLARIAVNNSDGRAATIYRVARLILGTLGGHTLYAERDYPAAYVLHVGGAAIAYPWDPSVTPLEVATALLDLITQATSAGVGVNVHYQTANDANTFTLSSSDVEETSATQGLADDTGTTGGQFSDYA